MYKTVREKKDKKGAVELSINTIVIVVIGITILTLGLRWVYGIFQNVEDQSDQLNKLSQQQILEIFGQSDATISLPQALYEVQQGDTVKINIYLRNTVVPGASYDFKYTINILDNPVSIQPDLVMSKVSWLQSVRSLDSGAAYQDTALFRTDSLPLGTYKFEAAIQCMSAGCDMKDYTQFIVDVI